MELLKIYDPTCTICSMLAGIDEEIALEESFFFRKQTLDDVARNPSTVRDRIKDAYVQDDGMVDLPIYMICSTQGEVKADGVVQNAQELRNLISAFRQWDYSKNAPSQIQKE
jgi:hypothetical protein